MPRMSHETKRHKHIVSNSACCHCSLNNLLERNIIQCIKAAKTASELDDLIVTATLFIMGVSCHFMEKQ